MSEQTIVQGNAIELLSLYPDKSINCIITSPPYWGLRDYKTEPIVWDGGEECKHEWGDEQIIKGQYGLNKDFNERYGGSSGERKQEEMKPKELNQGAFCSLCGAWRGQLGLEPTFQLYISHLIQIFDECKRVLRDDGTCWVVMGDTYSGGKGQSGARDADFQDKRYDEGKSIEHGYHQASGGHGKTRPSDGKIGIIPKSLCMIPERFAIAMVDKGWILRNKIVWYKPNCMPSSASDRFTVDFEDIFFFTKSKRYWFEQQFEPHLWASRDKRSINPVPPKSGKILTGNYAMNGVKYGIHGRNKRCVWRISTKPFKGSHFAVFPPDLVKPMILSGCPENGIVLDLFAGSGTVGVVSKQLGRDFIGFELNPEYVIMAEERIQDA